jgi:hypothetical protein
MHAGVCSPRIESDRPRLFIGTEQPDNFSLIGRLALTNMGLGEKAAAFAFVEKAMAAFPIEKDAMLGPTPIEMLARVAALTGNPTELWSLCRKCSRYRMKAHWLLRLDPMFDPLRNDPRFQKLAASEAPK